MKRRDFLMTGCKSCAAVGIGLMLGSSFLEACGTGKLSIAKATPVNGKVSFPVSDFENGNAKIVRINNYPFDVAIKKNADNTFLALVLMCTHAGHPLVKAGSAYYCTLHGSRFNGDGTVMNGPASKTLVHLPVAVNNAQLEITILKPVY